MTTPDSELAAAAAHLRAGRLVAFPTETVYGLGADATNPAAVAAIYAAKGRPDFNPLIVHVPDLAAAGAIARLDGRAERLAAAFWPGALTMVLPLREDAGIAPRVTAGLDTIALRIPAHPLARALLAAVGRPLAGPSANPSGRVSPTTAAHVRDGLGDKVAMILDGGACPVGLESTIVGLAGEPARLLRPGGVPAEAIEALIGRLERPAGGVAVSAPGMLE
ncbi:MAG: L-threonylcarbamoyladenylate synthase, partial [Ferrovibrionaceae bacterium]